MCKTTLSCRLQSKEYTPFFQCTLHNSLMYIIVNGLRNTINVWKHTVEFSLIMHCTDHYPQAVVEVHNVGSLDLHTSFVYCCSHYLCFSAKVKPSPPAAFEINNAEVLNCMLICLILNPLPLFFS